jgi:hypothetical protein
MSIWCASLQFNGNGCKEQNLNRSSGSIPERARDAISESNAGALEKGSSPGPGRDDSGSDETRLDSSASGTEHFRGLQFIVVAFQDPCCEDLAKMRECLQRA